MVRAEAGEGRLLRPRLSLRERGRNPRTGAKKRGGEEKHIRGEKKKRASRGNRKSILHRGQIAQVLIRRVEGLGSPTQNPQNPNGSTLFRLPWGKALKGRYPPIRNLSGDLKRGGGGA